MKLVMLQNKTFWNLKWSPDLEVVLDREGLESSKWPNWDYAAEITGIIFFFFAC